jgi:hypothetical protein
MPWLMFWKEAGCVPAFFMCGRANESQALAFSFQLSVSTLNRASLTNG